MMDSSNTPFLRRQDGASSNDDDHEYRDSEAGASSITLKPTATDNSLTVKKRRSLSNVFHPLIYLFAAWGLISFTFGVLQTLFPTIPPVKPEILDVYRPETLPPGLTACLCGASPAEAVALGCVFDALSSAWLPPHCRDPELTAEFQRSGPGPNGAWSYFADASGKIPMTIDEIAALGGTDAKFYATREYHVTHCVFYWQKYWRMRDTGAVMEEMYDTLKHVRHCGRLILNPVPHGRVLIEVPVVMNGSGTLMDMEQGHGHEGH
ncbi:hypothetical protein B0H66DRAFT_384334 [Apodospora peruviana]|uniref:Uncharacterized protein n=1 Tax=Apodospora peruviana TaxID=516989 RepID=A0AAE0HUA5_9PEZI|nr:hypothetical protein B0H66DRAFT_384334 [Apodospora peruviana]